MVLKRLDRLLWTGRLAVTSGYSLVAEQSKYCIFQPKSNLNRINFIRVICIRPASPG